MSEQYTPSEDKWWDRKYEKWCHKHFKPYPRILEVLLKTRRPDLPESDTENGEGIFLYGDLGVGKTVRAAQLLMQEQKRLYLSNQNGKVLRFEKTPKLLHRLKTSYGDKDGETEDQIIKEYQNAHLLVLDEFGLSKTSDWLLDILYLILDHRYDSKLPTIFTSNYELPKVAEVLGDERIASRIARCCKIIKKTPWDK